MWEPTPLTGSHTLIDSRDDRWSRRQPLLGGGGSTHGATASIFPVRKRRLREDKFRFIPTPHPQRGQTVEGSESFLQSGGFPREEMGIRMGPVRAHAHLSRVRQPHLPSPGAACPNKGRPGDK